MRFVNLLTTDGRVDRAAVFLDARRQHRVMSRHGWDWPECLRYSWLRARTLQYNAARKRMESQIEFVQDGEAGVFRRV